MHPYTILKSELTETLGTIWNISDEELRPDVFGSCYCIFSGAGNTIRLIWDGKDGYGYAQKFIEKEWLDIPIYLNELDVEGKPRNTQKIGKFLEAVANAYK